MLSESARTTSAPESRFRIQTPKPTARAVRTIALGTASERDVTAFVAGVATADLVVMVVPAGVDAQAAATIGRACSDRRVMTTAIVVRSASTTEDDLSTTLRAVRPWSLMVVVAGDEAYVADIVASFR
jgi:hypothetical protein